MVTSYINGKYLKEPAISPFDLGFLRGHGVIENLKTHQRQPIFLKKHLSRLEYSARYVGIPLPNSLEEIENIVYFLIEKNHFVESYIRIILTKGLTEDGITPIRESSLLILTTPLIPIQADYYEKGIRAITTKTRRELPHIKTLNYLPALMLLDEAKTKGAQEALYCSGEEILEGTTCNFFAVKGNTLITAPDQILPGITREMILQKAENLFPIELRPLLLDEIAEIDEAFTSSSIKGIIPIVAINDVQIGKGIPGPRTAEIAETLCRAFLELALD